MTDPGLFYSSFDPLGIFGADEPGPADRWRAGHLHMPLYVSDGFLKRPPLSVWPPPSTCMLCRVSKEIHKHPRGEIGRSTPLPRLVRSGAVVLRPAPRPDGLCPGTPTTVPHQRWCVRAAHTRVCPHATARPTVLRGTARRGWRDAGPRSPPRSQVGDGTANVGGGCQRHSGRAGYRPAAAGAGDGRGAATVRLFVFLFVRSLVVEWRLPARST